MNTDNIREAFEADYWKHFKDDYDGEESKQYVFERLTNGDYSSIHLRGAWWGYQAAHAANEKRIAELTEMYEEVLVDMRRLTKEIDSILTKGNPAEQASLCDIVHQARFVMEEMAALQAENKRLRGWFKYISKGTNAETKEHCREALSSTESSEDK